ncbi:MAG: peptide/nickel transport system ATP-binding protein, partial [Halobacteriales archaeon]
LEIHGVRDRSERRQAAERMLDRVGLASEAASYPHELSGGEKQRVSLARALVLNPDLLIADEPVSALDVSIQADVLSLIEELKAEFDLAVIFISHDLAIVREIADRVAVMYAGELVEVADAAALFDEPQHPYTRVLLEAIPTTDPSDRGRTAELAGEVPDPADPPPGCRFHPRCPAVVAPEDLDVPSDVWQSVFEFRVAVEAGSVDGDDPATLRSEYGLDDLPPAVAESVDEALQAVATGADERAAEVLQDAFSTPCTRDDPSLRETPAGHRAACHHYDPDD